MFCLRDLCELCGESVLVAAPPRCRLVLNPVEYPPSVISAYAGSRARQSAWRRTSSRTRCPCPQGESGENCVRLWPARPYCCLSRVVTDNRFFYSNPARGQGSSKCRLQSANWRQGCAGPFRANHGRTPLVQRFPSAGLKIGAIAGIVVGCQRILQSKHGLLPSAGEYCATLVSGIRSKPSRT